jgi:hypothetical protein
MLSDTKIQTAIEFQYSDVAPVSFFTLEFPDDGPWLMTSVECEITTAAAVGILSLSVHDDTGTFIVNVGLIPWQFAATTITRTITPAPDVSVTALFGPAISGYIPSGLTVFNGWQLLYFDFFGTPGVSYDGTIQFVKDECDG